MYNKYLNISLEARLVFLRDPGPHNDIWYDLASAAAYLQMWPQCLAHREPVEYDIAATTQRSDHDEA